MRKGADPAVEPGETVEVQGYRLPGGLLYVGEYLPSANSPCTPDPALIDPRLSVNRRRPDHAGEGMDYWPSYSSVSPECRAAYLEWLASGRRAPDVYVGYVFLFLYGLERRVLGDGRQREVSQPEARAIHAEVVRLLSIYGENRSFHGYASGFRDVILLSHLEATVPKPPEPDDQEWDLPLRLKLGLGNSAQNRTPIPAAWARAWVLQHPQTCRRTAAVRCREDFERLFEIRYAERYGEGMSIARNRTKLVATYRPASAAFRGPTLRFRTDFPDVSALSAPVEKLREIVEACIDELDGLSRWLGRNPDARGTLPALARLPPALLAEAREPNVSVLRQCLAERTRETDLAALEMGALFGAWPTNSTETFSKRDSVHRAQLLHALGFGIEPDVRFGSPRMSAHRWAVVFPLPPDAPESPSEAYTGGALLLHLATAVAAADGDVSRAEEEHLEAHLESVLHLAQAERFRLRAYLRWALLEPPSLAGDKAPTLPDYDGIVAPPRLRSTPFLGGTTSTSRFCDGRGWEGVHLSVKVGVVGCGLAWVQYVRRTYQYKLPGGEWTDYPNQNGDEHGGWTNDGGEGNLYPIQSGAGTGNPTLADTPDIRPDADSLGFRVGDDPATVAVEGPTKEDLTQIAQILRNEAERASDSRVSGAIGIRLKLAFIICLVDLKNKKVLQEWKWTKYHTIEMKNGELTFSNPTGEPEHVRDFCSGHVHPAPVHPPREWATMSVGGLESHAHSTTQACRPFRGLMDDGP